MGFRTYTSRKQEREEAYALGKKRFLDYFGRESSEDFMEIDQRSVLIANLSYEYYKANAEKRNILNMILNTFTSSAEEVNISEKNTGFISDLIKQDPAVRRMLMLFFDSCPGELIEIIHNYEFDKCYQEAGSRKKELLNMLKQHRSKNDSGPFLGAGFNTESVNSDISNDASFSMYKITENDINFLKEGRTGRFLAHFHGNDSELFPEGQKENVTLPATNFSGLVQPHDGKNTPTLAALAFYEHPQKTLSSGGIFSIKEKSYLLNKKAKEEGVELLKNFLITGKCDMKDTTKTEVIDALSYGKLGSIAQSIESTVDGVKVIGLQVLAKASDSFKACLNMYEQEKKDNTNRRSTMVEATR